MARDFTSYFDLKLDTQGQNPIFRSIWVNLLILQKLMIYKMYGV